MATLFRWLMRLIVAGLVLGALVVAGVYYLASRSLPDYDKTLTVKGISAPVKIVRDHSDIPHIFGKSEADVFFALGYAHAQDRLWQMMVMRRTAQGRLSEVFGKRTLGIDKIMRRLDLYNLAQQAVPAQSPGARSALDAYAAGVNARLSEINRDALGRGAPEMFLFDMPISPWRPADSLAVIKLMAVQTMMHLQREVLRARTSRLLSDPARLKDILPDSPGTGIAALPAYAALMKGLSLPVQHAAATPPRPQGPLSPFRAPGFARASNAWAAAPSRTASASTLLANDPHLDFTAPSAWYLARLQLPSGGVIGGTIPGLPAILSGRGKGIAWGITSSYLDDLDVHIEALNPDKPEQYRTPDGFAPFKTRKSIVEIKGQPPVTLTLRWTQNGPVLPPSFENVGQITPAGHIATMSWTALTPDDTSYTAAYDLMHAKTVEDAIDAGESFVAPSQNLVVADRLSVGMKTIGKMPRRDAKHDTKGRMPSRGWLEQNLWQGYLDYSANPEFIQPQGGIVGNTNNKTLNRPFPMHVSYYWGDTQRIHRWKEVMQRRQVHTRDSFIEAQLDTVSYSAKVLLAIVGADLWYKGDPAPEGTPERQRQKALKMLVDWNGEMNEHMPEPLIYAAWMRALQHRLIEDELGPLAAEYTHVDPLFIERVFRNVDGAGAWCDIIQSSAKETCTDIARQSLDEALLWIGERYGTALESLRWGDVHQAMQDHPVLGDVPILGAFVNIRQSTSGGDNTLNRGLTSGEAAHPFQNVHGPGYRGVYDLADPDSSVFITSTGQSGHPLSRHYDDLSVLWRRGEYVPMSLDEGLARAAAVGVTNLLPASQANQ